MALASISPLTQTWTLLLFFNCLSYGQCAIPKVNGFLHLDFSPSRLLVKQGDRVTGFVNVSFEDPHMLQTLNGMYIQACCLENSVASLSQHHFVLVDNVTKMFLVSVDGHNLGHTDIRFLVFQNQSTATDPTQVGVGGNTSDTWWLPQSYGVTVKSHPNAASIYLSLVTLGLIGINLVGVGGQIDGDQCIRLLKKPMVISIGMLCRFGVMPAVSRTLN